MAESGGAEGNPAAERAKLMENLRPLVKENAVLKELAEEAFRWRSPSRRNSVESTILGSKYGY